MTTNTNDQASETLMNREELQRALVATLLTHSPEARAQRWEEKNEEGVPLWVASVAFVSTARFYDYAMSRGFTKSSEDCQGYVEHLTNAYGVHAVGRWVQNGTVVVWSWDAPGGVKRIGFCSAPDYPALEPHQAPSSKIWLWRQLTAAEIEEAELAPTLGERSAITCLQHGAPMDECNCMTYPQAALAAGDLELARQFAEFDWATNARPRETVTPIDQGELDTARANMAAMLKGLKTPPVAYCPCGKQVQPNGEELCPACSLERGGQRCDYCNEPPTMSDPLVNYDRDHRVHQSCAADPDLKAQPKDRVECPACSAAGGLSAVYHPAPACDPGSPLVDENEDVATVKIENSPLVDFVGHGAANDSALHEWLDEDLKPNESDEDRAANLAALARQVGPENPIAKSVLEHLEGNEGASPDTPIQFLATGPVGTQAALDKHEVPTCGDCDRALWGEELATYEQAEAGKGALCADCLSAHRAKGKRGVPLDPSAPDDIRANPDWNPRANPTPAASEAPEPADSSTLPAESSTPDQRAQPTAAEIRCGQLDAMHPQGTPVLYWPGVKEGDGRLGRTRSRSWVLGGQPVVMVEGYAGGVAWSHIEVISEPEYKRAAETPDPAPPATCAKLHPRTGIRCEEKLGHDWTHGYHDPSDASQHGGRVAWPLDLPPGDEVIAEKRANESPEARSTYATVLYDSGDLVGECDEIAFCSLCAFSIPRGENCWRIASTMGPGGHLWGHDECVLRELQATQRELTEIEVKLFSQRREARRLAALPKKVPLVTQGMQAEAERAGAIEWAKQADLDSGQKQKKVKAYTSCRICAKKILQGERWVRRKGKSVRQRAHRTCVLAALKEAERGQEAAT